MTKYYNSASNTIDTIEPYRITSIPAYTFDFEVWSADNTEALDAIFAESGADREPNFDREQAELKLFEKGPNQNGIVNGTLIFRVELA